MNKVIQYVLTTALTSLFSMLIISAMLPKGLKVTQLPQLLKMIKQTHGNINANHLLALLEDEEKLAAMMTALETGEAPLVDSKSIATQVDNSGSVFIDQAELDKIDKMNISNELKTALKNNYAMVGSLPDAKLEITGVQPQADDTVRAPASAGEKLQITPFKSYEESLRTLHALLSETQQKPKN